MDTGPRTMRNFNTVNLSTIVAQICGPNPYRSALVFSPVGGSSLTTAPFVASIFNAGAGQSWTVPNGVTNVLDIFAWANGGNSGAAGAVLGGGGGGSGAFCTSGALTVVPGTIYPIAVGTGGGATDSTVNNPAGTQIVRARPGTTPVLDAAGTGGAATTGVVKQAGTVGIAATALAGAGGAGAGAPGYNAQPTAAAGQVGGVGGGAVTFAPYGVGGTGGNGANSGIAGKAATSPGAGGGGAGNNGAPIGSGADGLVVVFYAPSLIAQGISIDQDPALVLLQGAFNYIAGATYPTMISRRDIGDCIIEPWFGIAGLTNQVLRVTEYSYVPEASRRDVQGAGQAFAHPPYTG